MLTFALMLSLAVVPPPTAEEDGTSTVIAGVSVDPGVPEAQRGVFVREFEDALGRSAKVIAIEDPSIDWDQCGPTQSCFSDLDADGVRLAIVGEVRKEGRNFQLSIEARSVGDGKVIASSEDTCELCGVAEAQEMFAGQVGAFALKLENLERGPASFEIESFPAGANISVDGKLVGTAPLEIELGEGVHTLVATKEGFQPQRREVEAVAGTSEGVEFRLNPVPEVDPGASGRHDPGRTLRIAGWTSLGVGLAAIIPGAVFLGLEAQPVETNCSGDNIDADGDCKFRYSSLPHGIALTAVGSALVVTSAALLTIGYKRKSTESTPTARIGPRGFMLEGRF